MSAWLARLGSIITETEAQLLDQAIGPPIVQAELDRALRSLAYDYHDEKWETEFRPRLDRLYQSVAEENCAALRLIGRMRQAGEARVPIDA
jgi:hypothetical protein